MVRRIHLRDNGIGNSGETRVSLSGILHDQESAFSLRGITNSLQEYVNMQIAH